MVARISSIWVEAYINGRQSIWQAYNGSSWDIRPIKAGSNFNLTVNFQNQYTETKDLVCTVEIPALGLVWARVITVVIPPLDNYTTQSFPAMNEYVQIPQSDYLDITVRVATSTPEEEIMFRIPTQLVTTPIPLWKIALLPLTLLGSIGGYYVIKRVRKR